VTKHIGRETVFYAFGPDLQPAVRVDMGEEIVFETHDCFQGQIKTEADLVTNLDWNHTNPATGPAYLEGAQPGDILRLEVLDVEVESHSVMVTIPGEGSLGNRISLAETTILRQEGESLVYKDQVRIPLGPMIGVIGISPKSGSISNGVPADHGGNLDCRLIGTGSRLYLTVQVPGGLLGVGDLHAAMGDGEIVAVGAEVPGVVRLRPQIVDLPGLPTPFLETTDLVATLSSDPNLEVAVSGAVHNMNDFLTDFVGLSVNDAGMLMSAVGSLKICQVVDPAKTARFEFPKSVLTQLGYQLPD
jgi:amidase